MAFEFIVFSDLHAHNFQYGATQTHIPGVSGLYNSRLADTIGVLDEIIEYAKHNGIDTAFFCGDLFHRRASVSTDVRHLVVDRLQRFADEGIELHLIPGNHDMGDKHGNVHSLAGLEGYDDVYVHDLVRLVSSPSNKCSFVFVPYSDNVYETKVNLDAASSFSEHTDTPTILFAHLGVQGAKVGSDYVLVSDTDVSVSDIPHGNFAACFFGHFHEHQQLFPQGWFVGATHQHNFGDAGGSRGFLHCTLENDKVTFKQVETSAPKFVVIRSGDKKVPYIKHNDFVRYLTTDSSVDKELVQKEYGANNIEIIISDEEKDEDFKLDPAKLTPSAVLEQWVDSRLPEGLDKDKTLQVGRDILKEVDL